MRTILFCSVGISLAAGLALAGSLVEDGQPPTGAPKALAPRSLTFSKTALPLADALAQLSAGTGNRLYDARRQKTDPVVALPVGPTTFWPALDAMAKASGAAVSPHVRDGAIALTDAPYRAMATGYSGIFRMAVRRVASTLDQEAQSHRCQVTLDVAWEPRFRAFYVDLKRTLLTFAPDGQGKVLRDEVTGRGAVAIEGRGGVELEIAAAAPDRSCPKIAALNVTLWAVGPEKMLNFAFAKLAMEKGGTPKAEQPHATQEGVEVRIASIHRQADALLVKVEITNPKGGPEFESFQSWLENNRITLDGGKKNLLTPTGSQETIKGRRAQIVYEFTAAAGRALPSSLEGWTLRYETPGRLVELNVPFTFKDLPLP